MADAASESCLATFARARERDPTNAMALVNAGTVYLRGRRM